MSIKGTAIKLAIFSAVLLAFTAGIFIVFGQFRFSRTNEFSAIFTNSSGLKADQFVRANGVEVGKVTDVELIDGGSKSRVKFSVDKSLSLYQGTTAHIRYLDLIGNRYLDLRRGDSNQVLAPGGTIPVDRTEPALDLDALVGGFRPLFRSLDPQKVNTIASSLVTIFQGEGGTINNILDQTASFSSTIGEQDQAIGEVVKNLNTVLDTTVKHQKQFDDTLKNFESLVTGLKNRADPIADSVASISNGAGSLADLLGDNRELLHSTLGYLETTQQSLVDQKEQLNDTLQKVPQALKILGRSGGVYGDFFNFYVCDIELKMNGLQPGGPVRTVKLTNQPSGRCTPK
ncbi:MULTISPECIES: MCE family protein [Mycobacteriaceae]|mgnify:FL=1|uniref:Mammalian cell entry protein n=1 Tax=Mycolicibacterium phocaicum TaxID=319706 RepID=A0A7I7ZTR2_9MYCO|nr:MULTISPECIES: MCE family protein [Mycolicibacterium]MDX1877658.1 MCE family protein [Mycolicibacterium sp. 141076]TLH80958.1 mammalian cell entry protein [Mycolicibacterium phocaicum]UCZ60780.1 MCE family protein [Mycolicibacterium phocaicum]BBZ56514.1 mammalian cell entry protein [Mycolicibacterium phocaicum]